ncbi:MAG: acyltransferase, partial [Actinomycetota bacterium]|nr:acyltransferase [Actinomycetota bacterium]
LTGLRFLAAYMVLLQHIQNFAVIPLLAPYTLGAAGVSFFFVLSGFVLTWSFFPGDNARRFYWRRFARIWPLHVTATLLAIPVYYYGRHLGLDWSAIALSLLLLHAWSTAPATYFGGNPTSWTLSCEAFFYAVHPFIVRPVLRWRPALLAGTGAAVLLYLYATPQLLHGRLGAGPFVWLTYISPAYRVGEFVIGVLLAAALRHGLRVRIPLLAALAATLVWLVFIFGYADRVSQVMQDLAYGLHRALLPLLFAGVIAAAARLDLEGRPSWLRRPTMVRLGHWSYAFYLVHATIVQLLILRLGPRPPGNINLLWLLAVSIAAVAVSATLYHLVEHPLESWLRSKQKSRRTPEVVVHAPRPATAGAEPA